MNVVGVGGDRDKLLTRDALSRRLPTYYFPSVALHAVPATATAGLSTGLPGRAGLHLQFALLPSACLSPLRTAAASTPLALHARHPVQNHQPVLIFATASLPQRLRSLSRLSPLASSPRNCPLSRWPTHPFYLFAPPKSLGSIHHRQNGRPQPPSVSRPLRCPHCHSCECARTIAAKSTNTH